MPGNRTARRTGRRRGRAGLAVAALALTAPIAIGAIRAGAFTPMDPLTTNVNLADYDSPGAFQIGNLIFDPITCTILCSASSSEGWNSFSPLVTGPPLLSMGGASALGINLATQNFNVWTAGATPEYQGWIQTGENFLQMANDFGYNFKITATHGASLFGGDTLPSVGTDYSILQFNSPIPFIPNFTNVYMNTNANLDPSGARDVVVFPEFGNTQENAASTFPLPNNMGSLDLSGFLQFTGGLFTSGAKAGQMDPSQAFTALPDSTVHTGAFNIDTPDLNYTLAPFTSGLLGNNWGAWNSPVDPLLVFPPLLSSGGASVSLPIFSSLFGSINLATQKFEVFDGTTDQGTITTAEGMTTLFGLPNVEETVTSGSSGILGLGPSPIPVGTTFSVTNLDPLFHNGQEWVYISTPGGGSTQSLVSQQHGTLATMPGFFDLNDAGTGSTVATNPGNIFGGLTAIQSETDMSLGADAFTINGVTFDPVGGFGDVDLTLGGAPLLAAYGGSALGINMATQNFHLSADGSTSSTTWSFGEEIVKFLFFQNVSLTATTACGGFLQPDCVVPQGTVIDVLQILPGIYNIYMATPGGGAPFDEVVTALGPLFNFQLLLPASMNTADSLDPGIVTDGLVASSSVLDVS